MDELARKYVETHNHEVIKQLYALSLGLEKLDKQSKLKVLNESFVKNERFLQSLVLVALSFSFWAYFSGTMKLIPTPEQLAPKLPEQNKLTAQCDNCGHRDEVKVVATDQ
jgi:hypothetical protein